MALISRDESRPGLRFGLRHAIENLVVWIRKRIVRFNRDNRKASRNDAVYDFGNGFLIEPKMRTRQHLAILGDDVARV